MSLANEFHAAVREISREFESLQEFIAYTHPGGGGTVDIRGQVETLNRISQSARTGDGAAVRGYNVTVYGPGPAGLSLLAGGLLFIDNASRRVLEVRGTRDEDGLRFVTTLRCASHGPVFDPAFFTDSVSIKGTSEDYLNFDAATTYNASVQIDDARAGIEGDSVPVADVGRRVVFPGNAVEVQVGRRMELPDEFNLEDDPVISRVRRVRNPDDGMIDHIIAFF